MEIIRTVVGASTLGLIASLLTGAFTQAAELPKSSVLMLEAAQRVVQAAKKEAADHNWACVIAVPRPAAITAHDFVMMTGGVPIVGDGIVGAIGVSSDSPDRDVQVASAGVAALTR
jgi:uncharacterized protein GlcG (DUF336 family)